MINTDSYALLTDFYQLTMAYAYWKLGMDRKEGVFHLSFRTAPFRGGFTIAAGLETVIRYIDSLTFSESDLTYLSSIEGEEGIPFFDEKFIQFLRELRFTCSIDAIPEGTAVYPQHPLVRVEGPIIQCQLIESALLNIINFQTLIATKAARVTLAAQGDGVLEFGLRRAQGVDGSISASRAAFIGGCSATSNVLAGKVFGIPVKGTHAHSWVMAFDSEREAFYEYAKALPNNCIFLVDTYNTLEGVQHAIEVGQWLLSQGKKMLGIRLDSGDLNYLSIQARELLDAAGFDDAVIVASNDLDENIISELKHQGAKIAVWGVGTRLVTAKEQPALDGVYKLAAVRDPGGEWDYKMKLSEQMVKVSTPGRLQVRRFTTEEGLPIADMIYDIEGGVPTPSVIVDPLDSTRQKELRNGHPYEDLLVPVYREGKRVYTPPPLSDVQKHTKQQLKNLDVSVKRFLNPHEYPVGLEKSLYSLKIALISDIRHLHKQKEQ